MNDGSADLTMEAGDPWLYQMQMLEYHASHDEASSGRSEFSSIIVGTQYHDKATYDSLQHGDRLRLVRERDNEHDHNALAVLTIEGRKLGYVPRNDASLIAKQIDALDLLEIYATYRNGRIYLDVGIRSANRVSNDEIDQTFVDFDQLDDFQVRGKDLRAISLSGEKKHPIGANCWVGYHRELGPVICDSSKCFHRSKYRFQVWSHRSREYIPVDRVSVHSELIPFNQLSDQYLTEVDFAMKNYLSVVGQSGSLYWHGIPGLLNPVVTTGELFLDQRIGDSPWDLYTDR